MKVTYKIKTMAELVENVRLIKPEFTYQQIIEYIDNLEYVKEGIDLFDME